MQQEMPSSSLLLQLPKASLSPPAAPAHPHLRSSLALGQVFSEAASGSPILGWGSALIPASAAPGP